MSSAPSNGPPTTYVPASAQVSPTAGCTAWRILRRHCPAVGTIFVSHNLLHFLARANNKKTTYTGDRTSSIGRRVEGLAHCLDNYPCPLVWRRGYRLPTPDSRLLTLGPVFYLSTTSRTKVGHVRHRLSDRTKKRLGEKPPDSQQSAKNFPARTCQKYTQSAHFKTLKDGTGWDLKMLRHLRAATSRVVAL